VKVVDAKPSNPLASRDVRGARVKSTRKQSAGKTKPLKDRVAIHWSSTSPEEVVAKDSYQKHVPKSDGGSEMELEPEEFMQRIAPPPVVLVSTLYGETKNVAPFGMIMPVSSHPPLLALGVSEKRDTFKNIRETGEFVVGVAGPDLVKQIEVASEGFPRDVSEFDKAGLTPEKSRMVKPYRIGECQANFECRLEWLQEAGDHYIIVGRVVAAAIRDDVHRTGTREDIDPVYYVVRHVYARKGSTVLKPQRS
jgi:flavin reductase (DIM6/NTAB) family NADH-FMN oxidoreductase RutF